MYRPRLELQTISWRSSQNARLYVFDINTRKTFLSSPSPHARSYWLFCVQSLYDWPKNIYSILLTRPSKYMKLISLVSHDLYISLIGGLQRRVIGIFAVTFPSRLNPSMEFYILSLYNVNGSKTWKRINCPLSWLWTIKN